jgi:hypothetical protein
MFKTQAYSRRLRLDSHDASVSITIEMDYYFVTTTNNYVHGKLQNSRRASPNDIPQPARHVSS